MAPRARIRGKCPQWVLAREAESFVRSLRPVDGRSRAQDLGRRRGRSEAPCGMTRCVSPTTTWPKPTMPRRDRPGGRELPGPSWPSCPIRPWSGELGRKVFAGAEDTGFPALGPASEAHPTAHLQGSEPQVSSEADRYTSDKPLGGIRADPAPNRESDVPRTRPGSFRSWRPGYSMRCASRNSWRGTGWNLGGGDSRSSFWKEQDDSATARDPAEQAKAAAGAREPSDRGKAADPGPAAGARRSHREEPFHRKTLGRPRGGRRVVRRRPEKGGRPRS